MTNDTLERERNDGIRGYGTSYHITSLDEATSHLAKEQEEISIINSIIAECRTSFEAYRTLWMV